MKALLQWFIFFIQEESRESYEIFSLVILNKRDFYIVAVAQRYSNSFKDTRISCNMRRGKKSTRKKVTHSCTVPHASRKRT